MNINIIILSIVVPSITFSAPEGGVYIVNETFPVTFVCSATGIPPPTILWLRGDLLLDPIMNDTVNSRFLLSNAIVSMAPREVSTVTRMLTLNNAMDSDNGTYTCQANNTAVGGEDQEDFELFVQGELLKL